MRILIANDDGIDSPGITALAEMAREFGEVTVVAPMTQCSGMSQHVTVFGSLELQERKDFPAGGVRAYALSGTPADCVKAALGYVCDGRPDIVFTGINEGYNIGRDILYSGTVGAATEAMSQGIRAAAFSAETLRDLRAARVFIPGIIEHILGTEIKPYELWNINIPALSPEEIKGIDYDCRPSAEPFYKTRLLPSETEDADVRTLTLEYICCDEPESGSDIDVILKGRIAAGRIENGVMRAALGVG